MTPTTFYQQLASLWGMRIAAQGNLLPGRSRPFYIVTPPYTRISAGVKVLHSLCHYLNLMGENAYIIVHPLELQSDPAWPYFAQFSRAPLESFSLITPILTRDLAEWHFENGLAPICIYPEVYDDPLKAPFVARYILNYPGLLAPKYRTPQHMTVSYSQRLANFVGAPDIMHMPTIDLNFFSWKDALRKGTCYYAGKYRDIYGGDLSILPKGSIEIKRSELMTREEVREIFWSSELFYCFEDTALALEACLCGCATVFIPNEHFTGGPISSYEIGQDGMAWGNGKEEIHRALMTVANVREKIVRLYEAMPSQIAQFSERAKELAKDVTYKTPVSITYDMRRVFFVGRGARLNADDLLKLKTTSEVPYRYREDIPGVNSSRYSRRILFRLVGLFSEVVVKVTSRQVRWVLLRNVLPQALAARLIVMRERSVLQRQRKKKL